MNYVLIALIVIAVVLLVYLVSLRVEPVAKGVGFLCALVANIFVSGEDYLDQAASYWHTACIGSLSGIGDNGHWQGKAVLRLCMYCFLGSCILLGEVVGVMQVLHAMYPTMPDIASSALAEFAQAALFLCCPALFGDILLTCCNIQGGGLFKEDMGTFSRWILGIVSLGLLAFTIAVNSYFYMYRGMLLSPSLADRQAAQQMIPYILTGLGLEVSTISPFCLMAIFEGMGGGVIPLLLWVAALVCKVISALLSFPPHLLDVLGIRVCGMTVYQTFRMPGESALPVVIFRKIGDKRAQFLPESLPLKDGEIASDAALNGHGKAVPDTEPLPILAEKETPVKPIKPEKPKKQKRAGISRWFVGREFLPFENAQPGQDPRQTRLEQSNGKAYEQPGVNGNVHTDSKPTKRNAGKTTNSSRSKPAAVRRGRKSKQSTK